MADQDQEISVEMDDDEDMDQTTPTTTPGPAPTSVIVSVSGDGQVIDSDSDQHSSSSTHSPSHSPQFTVPDITTHRLLAATRPHMTVRQTLSEPGLKAKVHRQKQRLSPIPRRHNDLAKTLSVGSSLDTSTASATGAIMWKPMEMPRSPTTMEGDGEDTPTATTSSHALPGAIRLPTLGGLQPNWLAAQGIIASQEQMEAIQKQKMELIEQQKRLGVTTGLGAEMFQFPLTLWTFSGQTPPQFQLPTSTTSNSATPSPTPSNSSTDSGISSITSGESLSIGGQRRPLSESQSAPGFHTAMPDVQYEAMVKQYQLQHQQLMLNQQQLYQQYLEQQQKLMQQAMLERRHFEDQQKQLAALHARQQQQLQKQQQLLLRQMQEQQLVQLQRQQQMLLLQSMSMTQQQQAAATQHAQLAQVQALKQMPVRRIPAKDTICLPYSNKPVLTATNSSGSTASIGGQEGVEMSTLSVEQIQRSPSLTPKASLTPTNSLESINGRTSPSSGQEPPQQGGTGLVYDTMMLKHSCNCGGSHPEHPGRLQSIWARLHETRVILNCRRLRARKASLAELQAIHSENHVRLYGRPSQRKPGQERRDSGRAFIQLSCGGLGVDQDTYWSDIHTSNAARMAVGSVIELADKVVNGEVKNGFAFVRPPGHHALPNQAMAFCYFNNVALAAKAMVSKNKRVMVVDWDIHHGNGTQQIFYDNPSVLYVSLHRYDNGTFFPGTGRPEEIGSGAGLGFNVNIAFSGNQNMQGFTMSSFGDPEYLAAFRTIVIPIAKQFNPDITLVSAGFNATEGHPPTLGGYSVTPKCYALMTKMLMNVGNGRVALALEGGYELMSLCASAEVCMRALLGKELPPLDGPSMERQPQSAAISSIEKTLAFHKPYWSSLLRTAPLLHMSYAEAEKREMEEADTVTALASLSVAGDMQQRSVPMGTAV